MVGYKYKKASGNELNQWVPERGLVFKFKKSEVGDDRDEMVGR